MNCIDQISQFITRFCSSFRFDEKYFSYTWLSNIDFSKRIVNVTESTQTKCTLCKKDFNFVKMGIKALELHAKRQKYQEQFKEADEVANLFTKAGK